MPKTLWKYLVNLWESHWKFYLRCICLFSMSRTASFMLEVGSDVCTQLVRTGECDIEKQLWLIDYVEAAIHNWKRQATRLLYSNLSTMISGHLDTSKGTTPKLSRLMQSDGFNAMRRGMELLLSSLNRFEEFAPSAIYTNGTYCLLVWS